MTDQIENTAAEKPAKPERPKLETANGVAKPAEGSKTRRGWDIASSSSAEKQRPALRSEVMEVALAEGLNRGTVATQYGKWCTFYAVTSDARKSVRAENREAAEAQAAATEAEAPAQPEAAVSEAETTADDGDDDGEE